MKDKLDAFFENGFSGFYDWFNESKSVKIFFFIFLVAVNFLLLKDYSLWRDVARPLLYINDSNSIVDLYKIVQYDSTPMMFHFSLWCISKITPLTPAIIKGVHFCIHLLMIYVVLFVLRLPNVFRLLILLQIPSVLYVLYIRQYSLTALFSLLFAHFYSTKGMKSIWVYVSLFLLSQTCSQGCLIATVFFFFVVMERLLKEKTIFDKNYLLPLLGMVLAVVCTWPPGDLIEGLRSFRPITNPVENLAFLGTFFSDVFLNDAFVTIGFLIIMFVIFKRSFAVNKQTTSIALFCLFVLFSGFIALGMLKYSFNRHHWMLSYALISVLIILSSQLKESKNVVKSFALVLLLGFSFLNFSALSYKYSNILFSNGSKVAKLLDEEYPDKTVIGAVEYFMEPIFAYRKNSHKYYSLGRHDFVKYTILNHDSVDYTRFKDYNIVLSHSEIFFDLADVPDEILNSDPVVILSAHSYEKDFGNSLEDVAFKKDFRLKHIKDFDGALFENYRLYRLIMTAPVDAKLS